MKRKTIITPIYLSDQDLAVRFNISRQTVWRWARLSDLPAPIKLSNCCTRWLFSEISAWEDSRRKVGS